MGKRRGGGSGGEEEKKEEEEKEEEKWGWGWGEPRVSSSVSLSACLGEWKVSVTFLEVLNTQTFRASLAPLAPQRVNLQKLSAGL